MTQIVESTSMPWNDLALVHYVGCIMKLILMGLPRILPNIIPNIIARGLTIP
jgi:hypothetical protein